jgi:hypothetical protein
VKFNLIPLDHPQVQGKKIKTQRSFGFGSQADQFAFVVLLNFFINIFDIRGFATESRSIIDDFKIDFSGGIIKKRQT